MLNPTVVPQEWLGKPATPQCTRTAAVEATPSTRAICQGGGLFADIGNGDGGLTIETKGCVHRL